MALIKCKECGIEVSNKAVACPKCGAPVAKVARKPIGCGGAIFIIVLVLIGGYMIDNSLRSNEPRTVDAQSGSREVTSTASIKPPTVAIGTLADTVLALRGKAPSSAQVGQDDNGLLVEWRYPDATYLMGRRLQGGIEAYRVIKVTPAP